MVRSAKELISRKLSKSLCFRDGTYLAVMNPCFVSPKSNLGVKGSGLGEPSARSSSVQMLLEVTYPEGQSR
jgi:hypothetical protein